MTIAKDPVFARPTPPDEERMLDAFHDDSAREYSLAELNRFAAMLAAGFTGNVRYLRHTEAPLP